MSCRDFSISQGTKTVAQAIIAGRHAQIRISIITYNHDHGFASIYIVAVKKYISLWIHQWRIKPYPVWSLDCYGNHLTIAPILVMSLKTSHWRHNERDDVSNNRRLDCLLIKICSDADQKSSASLAYVREIHRWPVNSPHKRPATRIMLPFDDVIIKAYGRKRPVSIHSKTYLLHYSWDILCMYISCSGRNCILRIIVLK